MLRRDYIIYIRDLGRGHELSKRPASSAPRAGGKTIPAGNRNVRKTQEKPGWANGLRQLYDSVVDEPLPDNFADLLAKLDRDTQ